MADITINLGQCFTATPVAQKFVFKWTMGERYRGSIKNKSTNRVFLGWNKTPAANDSDEADKAYLDQNESCRIPHRCNYFVALTASGSSKCIEIED